jgi:hypothetical protein
MSKTKKSSQVWTDTAFNLVTGTCHTLAKHDAKAAIRAFREFMDMLEEAKQSSSTTKQKSQIGRYIRGIKSAVKHLMDTEKVSLWRPVYYQDTYTGPLPVSHMNF